MMPKLKHGPAPYPSRLLVAAFACTAACSDAASPSELTAVSEDALRALTAGEVVGPLTYGQTSPPVVHDAAPTYRAFTFEGTEGDDVQIDVRAEGADARAWLLAPSFRTLARNDNASPDTRDARIAARLTQTGRHYIAFRETNYEEATFTVTLVRRNGTAPPPPPTEAWRASLPTGTVALTVEVPLTCRSWNSESTKEQEFRGSRTITITGSNPGALFATWAGGSVVAPIDATGTWRYTQPNANGSNHDLGSIQNRQLRIDSVSSWTAPHVPLQGQSCSGSAPLGVR